jgi:hypothetical protein
MKLLKFKAYNKKTNVLVFEGTLQDVRMMGGKLSFTTWEWVLFTGLKDKANEDIYEGDILKTDGGVVYVVTRANVWENFNKELVMNINVLSHTRKIGNVYQNPELLK